MACCPLDVGEDAEAEERLYVRLEVDLTLRLDESVIVWRRGMWRGLKVDSVI